MKYKKYIIFEFCNYYPTGGLDDISNSVDTVEEYEELGIKNCNDYFIVVNRDTWEVVFEK
tara:strand:+ start:182 stop:361 length:180 start_codon:yes stop_codon:yes gene_type:complete